MTTLEPSENFLEPSHAALEPSENFLEPSHAALEPSENFLEPSNAALEPSKNFLEPSNAALEPSEIVLEPSHAALETSESVLNTAVTTQQGRFLASESRFGQKVAQMNNHAGLPRPLDRNRWSAEAGANLFPETTDALVRPQSVSGESFDVIAAALMQK